MLISKSLYRLAGMLTVMVSPIALGGCAMFGASGPSTSKVHGAQHEDPRIKVVELTDGLTRQIVNGEHRQSLAQAFGDTMARGNVVGRGDVLDVSIWEAPPAALFSTGAVTAGTGLAHSSDIPAQMVDDEGRITVPFAGSIDVLGRKPSDIAREINARLKGKAHDPQTIVRIADNQAANVTVVGDVVNSRRMQLTSKGERLLDALASAGGVRQPVDKVMIQITRGTAVVAQPLGAVIRDPNENIRLQANDVITALYQPYSFQALGAFGVNGEVNFEGTGISLAQALGRVGGLQDNRANIKGVFIFRLADPKDLPPAVSVGAKLTPDGKVPVIFRVDMGNPATFFVAQSFPIHNKDVLYVSNAPIADMQKFVNVVSQLAFSVAGITSAVP